MRIFKKSDQEEFYNSVIRENTTSRKSDSLVNLVASNFSDILSEVSYINKPDLKRAVSKAASEASEEVDSSFGEKAIEKVVESVWEKSFTRNVSTPKVKQVLEEDADEERWSMIRSLHYAMQNTKVSRPL
jgi:hypothetical protein